MNDEHTNLPVSVDEHDNWSADCELHSHASCDESLCQVRHLAVVAEEITEGQISAAVATAYAGLGISSVYALALLVVWVAHAMVDSPMPAVPWYITTMATAMFTAGGISALRIPKKMPWRLVDNAD